ncbi:MAG: quinol:electron acceptor oxidoreductase subunit ActD [Rhodothermales bacterium]|nr:quinol:electron acceptor oxidoreductase subunit ActD [Rhodothermales bacterium]
MIFELTILFAALGAVGGMFALNGLPRPYNPLFYSSRFSRVTDDAFFLHIAASDRLFDVEKTKQFLRDIGALYVEPIEDRGDAED